MKNYSENLTTKHISRGDSAADKAINHWLIQSVIYQHLRCRIVRKKARGRAPWPLELIGAVAGA